MKTNKNTGFSKSILCFVALLAIATAASLAQTEGGSVAPTSQGPNLKPRPASGALPIPLMPSEVDAKTVADFDAAVAAMKPVPNNMDITVDVVGLDINAGSSEEQQLNNVAAAGAGKYYGVADAAKLAGVFAQVATGKAAPAPTSGGGGGMVLPKAGLSAITIGTIALGFLCLVLLAGMLIVRNRRAGAPAATAGKFRARADVLLPDGRQSAYDIRTQVTSIGRAGDNAIILEDDQVSGHHAEIYAGREGFRIRDLGSSNGTFLRGERISDSALYAGDEVTVGSTRIVLGE